MSTQRTGQLWIPGFFEFFGIREDAETVTFGTTEINVADLAAAAGGQVGGVAVGDITGLGTGVATWLATPSSSNLAAAVTDETGSGALVFANTPTLVTPVLGAATGTTLALTQGAITDPAALLSGTATWNDGAYTFNAFSLVITDTASALLSTFANFKVGSDSFFRVKKNGAVRVGTGDGNTDESCSITTVWNNSSGGGSGVNPHGYGDISYVARGGTVAYACFNAGTSLNNVVGATDYDHIVGFQSNCVAQMTGTVTEMYGLFDGPHYGGGTVTNRYGVYIDSPVNDGSGTLTNNYGIYVAAQSTGTNRYPIYSAATQTSRFFGDIAGDATGASVLRLTDAQGAALIYSSTYQLVNAGSIVYHDTNGVGSLRSFYSQTFVKFAVCDSTVFAFSSTSDAGAALDAGVGRNAAGIVEINSGTAGAFRDLKARKLCTPMTGELTIAAGVITVTGGYHRVDTQSDDATDDLDTISGGADGDILTIRAENDGRTVVVKDGTGNLQIAGDMTLDNTQDTITLRYDGTLTAWLEIGRAASGA